MRTKLGVRRASWLPPSRSLEALPLTSRPRAICAPQPLPLCCGLSPQTGVRRCLLRLTPSTPAASTDSVGRRHLRAAAAVERPALRSLEVDAVRLRSRTRAVGRVLRPGRRGRRGVDLPGDGRQLRRAAREPIASEGILRLQPCPRVGLHHPAAEALGTLGEARPAKEGQAEHAVAHKLEPPLEQACVVKGPRGPQERVLGAVQEHEHGHACGPHVHGEAEAAAGGQSVLLRRHEGRRAAALHQRLALRQHHGEAEVRKLESLRDTRDHEVLRLHVAMADGPQVQGVDRGNDVAHPTRRLWLCQVHAALLQLVAEVATIAVLQR
mmetsp:Transcript_59155/g.152132  ORF Transcript_59155/g.152132 Transcript_59155/m.152132 type:complete len:324 (+) Transcript_59155:679-1650(+)